MGEIEAGNFESVPQKLRWEVEDWVDLGNSIGNDGVMGPRIVQKIEVEFDHLMPVEAEKDSAEKVLKDGGRLIAEGVKLWFRGAGVVLGAISGR